MEEKEELAVAETGTTMPETNNVAKRNIHNNDDNVDPGNDGYASPEHTRSTVALLFIIGFFSILFLCFVSLLSG